MSGRGHLRETGVVALAPFLLLGFRTVILTNAFTTSFLHLPFSRFPARVLASATYVQMGIYCQNSGGFSATVEGRRAYKKQGGDG
jgi:hypothetical protein